MISIDRFNYGDIPEQDGDPIHFKSYSWPVSFFWESAKVTFLQLFPMYGISILNFDHAHSFMDICYVFSGSGYMKIGEDTRLPMKKGSCCFINAKVTHRLVSDQDEPLELANLSFELTPLSTSDKIPASLIQSEEEMLRALTSAKYLCAEDTDVCGELLRRAIMLKNSRIPGDFVKFKACMSDFLMNAIQLLTGRDKENVPLAIPESEMMQSAMKMVYYMRDHYAEGITLNDVATALNYSPRQCQRLIQDSLGVGFSDFILAHQLRHAKRLLAQTEASLEEIAEQVGFKSSKSLSQQFKASVGVTPFEFRRSWRQNGENSKYADLI